MTTSASETQPELIVLPEAVFISPWFVYDTALHGYLAQLADRVAADLLFGADNREPHSTYIERLRQGLQPPAAGKGRTPRPLPRMNFTRDEATGTTIPEEPESVMAAFPSAWQVKPDSGLQPFVYDKVQLVPFGEQAPILGHIPYFQDKIMMVGAFQRGTQQVLFETAGLDHGVMICFESTFARLARAMAAADARFISVITNDAWYDPRYAIDAGGFWGTLFRLPLFGTLARSGPDQHWTHSIMRAVETRLPVVRAANTGISGVVGPGGDVVGKTKWADTTLFSADLDTTPHPPTVYVRFGDWLGKSALGLIWILIGGRIAKALARRIRRPAPDT